MIPMHVLEGITVRTRRENFLYHQLAPLYRWFRPVFQFGEKLFLQAVAPQDLVLELGSGTGYLSNLIAKRTRMVIGLERDRQMLAHSPRRENLFFLCGDMLKIPFRPETFQRCVSLGSIHCVNPDDFFQEVSSVLCSGGEILVLMETTIIPLIAPQTSLPKVLEAIRKSGLNIKEEISVGRLYHFIRAGKN